MQDAYYGLAFSYAVDDFQDAVGFDENYRSRTGCTIFVVEDHKFYLNEVKLGSELEIKTTLLDIELSGSPNINLFPSIAYQKYF